MITKKEFVSVIESMNEQFRHDKDYSFLVQSLFKTEDAALYDNDKLIMSLLLLLRKYFPVVDDFCEISHYCYVLDFGKNGDNYESPEEFYDRLVKSASEISVSDYREKYQGVDG